MMSNTLLCNAFTRLSQGHEYHVLLGLEIANRAPISIVFPAVEQHLRETAV